MAQTIINNALQEWQQEINKAKDSLHPDEGGACYIMSLTRRKQGIVGGVMSKVNDDTAALHIAGETHREATPEEIAEWNATQDRKREAQIAEAAKRDTKFNFDLGPIAEMLLKLGAAQNQAAATVAAAAPPVAEVVAPVAEVVAPSGNTPVRVPTAAKTAAKQDTDGRF